MKIKNFKKIEIQKERYIKYGYQFKIETQRLSKLVTENKKLKDRISCLEKNDRIAESVQWGEDFPEEGWETSSELECSYSEDLPSGDLNLLLSGNKSKNVTVIDLDKSDSSKSENSSLIVQANKSVSGRKDNKSKSPKKFISSLNVELNIETKKPNLTSQLEKTVTEAKNLTKPHHPDEKVLNKKTTASQTTEPPKQNWNNKPKKVCKFYLEKRCHFGNRCFNLHTDSDEPRNFSHSANFLNFQHQNHSNGLTLQNRFQALNLTDHNEGPPHMYWSLPLNPQQNNEHLNLNDYPPLINAH